MRKSGDRIGAIRSAKNNTVQLLGYGTYLGDEVPGDLYPRPTPKLQLDNGNVVWGFQCWWGSESAVRSRIDMYKRAGWVIEEVE